MSLSRTAVFGELTYSKIQNMTISQLIPEDIYRNVQCDFVTNSCRTLQMLRRVIAAVHAKTLHRISGIEQIKIALREIFYFKHHAPIIDKFNDMVSAMDNDDQASADACKKKSYELITHFSKVTVFRQSIDATIERMHKLKDKRIKMIEALNNIGVKNDDLGIKNSLLWIKRIDNNIETLNKFRLDRT